MAYFLPSYIQKRALRYALTYLDFLETDDLDLDKLGVTMGRRNVIELKDVGFRIKVRLISECSKGWQYSKDVHN
jgi:autophagy-related protein 2